MLTLALYSPTLSSYLDSWRDQPYMHHGYLVALIVVWVVWRKRAAFTRGSAPAPTWVRSAAAGLSLAWLAATVADLRLLSTAIFPVLLLLWSASAFGLRAFRTLIPAAGIFMLAVPFWAFLNAPLQAMTVAVSGTAVDLLGIPAVIDQDLIHVSHGSFHIEGGCAGVNYLAASVTIGLLSSEALSAPPRAARRIVALAVALALVSNWIRVASLIIIGEITRMQSIFVTQSRAHVWYGWVVFLGLLLVFFAVTVRLVPPSASIADEPSLSHEKDVAIRTRLRPALTATVALLPGPLLLYAVGAIPSSDVPAREFGQGRTEWRSHRPPPDGRPYEWRPAFVGADEYETISWTDGARGLLVDHIVYKEESQGAELIGYPNRIAPAGATVRQRVVGGSDLRPMLLNEAVIWDGASYLLVWYWYRVGGWETAYPWGAKLLEVPAFFRRTDTAELFALSTPCAPRDCTDAERLLADFLRAE